MGVGDVPKAERQEKKSCAKAEARDSLVSGSVDSAFWGCGCCFLASTSLAQTSINSIRRQAGRCRFSWYRTSVM